jgi:hypothetical protein
MTARTLLLVDSLAIGIGTAGAFIFRTGVRSYDSLAPDHLVSLIVPAFPFALAACVASFWSSGFYRPRRAAPEPIEVATALAWAAALLAFIAFYWAKGPEAPLLVMVAGYALVLASVLAGRAFLRARQAANVT